MKKLLLDMILMMSIIKLLYSQNCKNNMTINIDNTCFNEIILFNNKNYRAGHFAINSKGDMVVEYSDGHSRLFYGLKKDGRFFLRQKIIEKK